MPEKRKIVAELADIQLFEEDVALLGPRCWLNDQLIAYVSEAGLKHAPCSIAHDAAVPNLTHLHFPASNAVL